MPASGNTSSAAAAAATGAGAGSAPFGCEMWAATARKRLAAAVALCGGEEKEGVIAHVFIIVQQAACA